MTQTTAIEGHLDLMETRTRYDEAAETPQARVVEGLTVLAGLYMAISPWVVQFSATSFDLAMSNLITGLALAVMAIGLTSAFSRTHNLAWVTPLIGVWTVIAPFVVMGGLVTTSIVLSNVILGGVTVVLGLGLCSLGLMRRFGSAS